MTCRDCERLRASVAWAREQLWTAYRAEWDHRRRETLRCLVEALSPTCPKIRPRGEKGVP